MKADLLGDPLHPGQSDSPSYSNDWGGPRWKQCNDELVSTGGLGDMDTAGMYAICQCSRVVDTYDKSKDRGQKGVC